MRRSSKLLVMALGFLAGIALLAGCKKTTISVPLAPGYSAKADQQLGLLLSSARKFYLGFEHGVTSGEYTETAAERSAFQSFSLALNAADAAYVAYHAGTGSFAAAQTAGDQVQAQQAQILTQFPNTAGVK